MEARAWAAEPVFLLAPDQVSAIADALGRALGSPVPVADRETRLRHLEMAARLPILAARAGWTPVATRGTPATLSPEDLQRLALLAHEGYKSVSAATNNATGSANFRKEWDQLAEVDQRSNIAQVADIPVKLATLGLTWRSASEPVPFTFTNEQVEELAENEHRRWVHFQYRNGRPGHQWNQTWAQLLATAEQNKANGEPEKDPARYDRNAVRRHPAHAGVGRAGNRSAGGHAKGVTRPASDQSPELGTPTELPLASFDRRTEIAEQRLRIGVDAGLL